VAGGDLKGDREECVVVVAQVAGVQVGFAEVGSVSVAYHVGDCGAGDSLVAAFHKEMVVLTMPPVAVPLVPTVRDSSPAGL
jgi:hypothetical protein